MYKKIISIMLVVVSCLSISALFTGCGSSSTEDPEVKAYNEHYIRTHDMFGNPR